MPEQEACGGGPALAGAAKTAKAATAAPRASSRLMILMLPLLVGPAQYLPNGRIGKGRVGVENVSPQNRRLGDGARPNVTALLPQPHGFEGFSLAPVEPPAHGHSVLESEDLGVLTSRDLDPRGAPAHPLVDQDHAPLARVDQL